MIEDSAISITYNLRLLFNPGYTISTIDIPSQAPFVDDVALIHYRPAPTISFKFNWSTIGEYIYYPYLLQGGMDLDEVNLHHNGGSYHHTI